MSTLFVIGGARSGKSGYALSRAEVSPGELVFIATAQALDAEMAERIRRHRIERGARWRTVEAPIDLPGAIIAEAGAERVLLIDCLTLWLSNLMLADADPEQATKRLLAAAGGAAGTIIMVSNEVGLGIVPDNPLGRRFRDAAGRLNQSVATLADEAVFLAAGLPLLLKGSN